MTDAEHRSSDEVADRAERYERALVDEPPSAE